MTKYLLIAAITLSSCSASWHIKRAVKKDPTILKATEVTITHRDTILVRDTLYYKGVDTSISFDIDSIRERFREVVLNDSTRIRVLLQKNGKLLLELSRKPDTVYYEKRVPYEVRIQAPCPPQVVQPYSWWDKFFIGYGKFFFAVSILALIFVGLKLIKR